MLLELYGIPMRSHRFIIAAYAATQYNLFEVGIHLSSNIQTNSIEVEYSLDFLSEESSQNA